MRSLTLLLCIGCALLSFNCSEAQSGKGSSHKNAEAGFAGGNEPGLVQLGRLKGGIRESSGLANASQGGNFYTLADGGNPPVLYRINLEGEVLDRIIVPAPNNDWESLAEDNSGNLYIADCGNNDNKRKDLAIYKFNPAAPGKAEAIAFRYADQEDFPPKKKERNFDCEAVLWHQNKLYLFTRDRGRERTSNVYSLTARAGNHTAERIASLPLNAQVTGADLSPDNRTLALISKGKLFIFKSGSFPEMQKAKPKIIDLPNTGQTEGVVFTDNTTLLITSEEGGLYQYRLE